jgi:hypothetical protein
MKIHKNQRLSVFRILSVPQPVRNVSDTPSVRKVTGSSHPFN